MTLNVRNFVFQHQDTRESILTRRKGRKRAGKIRPERGGLRTARLERHPEEWLKLAAPIKAWKPRRAKLSDRPQYAPQPLKPLAFERPREKFAGLYGREQYEADLVLYEQLRSMHRTAFVKGQLGTGPMIDGCKYLHQDNLLMAEIDKCHRRFGATVGMIIQSKNAAKLAKQIPTPKQAANSSKWIDLGTIEMAHRFAQKGYKVRTIEAGRTKRFEALVIGAPK